MALSLAQSSFLLSSLVSSTPHRQDGRTLESFRPLQLHPPVETGYAHIELGSTSVTSYSSCQAVRSAASMDQSNEETDDNHDMSEEGAGSGAGLWNVNISTASNVIPPVSNGGNSSMTGCIELDNQLEHLGHLIKRHLTSVIPVEQFLILPNSTSNIHSTHSEKLRGATYWSVHIDVTIESLSGGNLYDSIWASVFSSLYRTRIPRTREIAYIPPGAEAQDKGVEELGIGSLKGQGSSKRREQQEHLEGQSKAIDFELVDGSEEGGEPIQGRERLGVGITIGLLPNYTHLLDPSLEEELSLPSSRRLFIVASSPSQVHTTHLLPSLLNLTAGEGDIPSHITDASTGLMIPSDDSIRFPRPQDDEQEQKWEQNCSGWGVPSFSRVKLGIDLGVKLAEELGNVLRNSLDKEQ
ncbi:unnamed protein product [Sympodiomycopsis kandeliae]